MELFLKLLFLSSAIKEQNISQENSESEKPEEQWNPFDENYILTQ